MIPYKTSLCEQVERLGDGAVQLAKFLFEHPETAYREHQAVTEQVTYLRNHGFSVEVGIGGLNTAYAATWQCSELGPKIVFLPEYDALPGLGHACGHHLICGAALLAAAALKTVAEQNNLPITIVVAGAPAEENGGGKITLLEQGIYDNSLACLMFHPSYASVACPRTLCNSSLTVEFFGVSSHAGSNPEEGKSALTSLLSLFRNLDEQRMHLSSDSRIHGVILDGGRVENIIPEYAKGSFTLRTNKRATLADLRQRFNRCAEAAALSCDVEYAIQEKFTYAALVEAPEILSILHKNMSSLGQSLPHYDENSDFVATDAGNVSEVLPLIHPMISIVEDEFKCALHSSDFAEKANLPYAYEQMIVAAKALAMTGLDVVLAHSCL